MNKQISSQHPMTNKQVETIIIGAGISGLACAQHLQQHNKDFLLLSKDIGGRIRTSTDGRINYGAFFICSDYHHVLQHVTLQNRIRIRDFCFHEPDHSCFKFFELQLLAYAAQFIKVINCLYKFRKALRKLRITSTNISQKTAIENDEFLYKLYMKNAAAFITELHLEKGTERYLSKALNSTTFSQVHQMNAFSFLQFLLPLITPIYTFTFNKEQMIEPFKEKILIGTALDVKYKDLRYHIKFQDTRYQSKNIVLATDILWSQQFSGIEKTNKPIATNMIHLAGQLHKTIPKKKYHLFSPQMDAQAIADNTDGTYLLYYKEQQPNLKNYFSQSKILASHQWNPAGTINGHTLIESYRGNNMYLIGDYNVAGLEESFITGLYCAHHIILNEQ